MRTASPYRVPGKRPAVVEPVAVAAARVVTTDAPDSDAELIALAAEAEPREDKEIHPVVLGTLVATYVLIMFVAVVLFFTR
ncbi:MAG: hypothetical protein JWO86_8822 [Myxococcaceae bacterium]|nr:hypothetical protein [Myxococcaceae bacterium]